MYVLPPTLTAWPCHSEWQLPHGLHADRGEARGRSARRVRSSRGSACKRCARPRPQRRIVGLRSHSLSRRQLRFGRELGGARDVTVGSGGASSSSSSTRRSFPLRAQTLPNSHAALLVRVLLIAASWGGGTGSHNLGPRALSSCGQVPSSANGKAGVGTQLREAAATFVLSRRVDIARAPTPPHDAPAPLPARGCLRGSVAASAEPTRREADGERLPGVSRTLAEVAGRGQEEETADPPLRQLEFDSRQSVSVVRSVLYVKIKSFSFRLLA